MSTEDFADYKKIKAVDLEHDNIAL